MAVAPRDLGRGLTTRPPDLPRANANRSSGRRRPTERGCRSDEPPGRILRCRISSTSEAAGRRTFVPMAAVRFLPVEPGARSPTTARLGSTATPTDTTARHGQRHQANRPVTGVATEGSSASSPPQDALPPRLLHVRRVAVPLGGARDRPPARSKQTGAKAARRRLSLPRQPAGLTRGASRRAAPSRPASGGSWDWFDARGQPCLMASHPRAAAGGDDQHRWIQSAPWRFRTIRR